MGLDTTDRIIRAMNQENGQVLPANTRLVDEAERHGTTPTAALGRVLTAAVMM